MFKKLKRKFILTNTLTSAAVLIVAFSAIYVIASATSGGRVPRPADDKNHPEQSETVKQQSELEIAGKDYKSDVEFDKYLEEQLRIEREASLKSLLISLIVTGVAVEGIIVLISLYLAEQSIKPVRDAYQAQKDFVANASHEIKTPLAVIQANLEAADIKNNKWIDNASKKAEDLANLNNKLLALARSESMPENNEQEGLNVKRVLLELISAFEPKAAEAHKKISISNDFPEDYTIKTNRQAFEQILSIYIDNGVKYAKKNIVVNVEKNKVFVSSDGKLLSKTELSSIFERFYQSDKTREGVGLGLAIAKSLSEKNHMKVYARTDEASKTNIFVLEF